MWVDTSLAPLLVVMGCLMVGAILKVLLKKRAIPYTVGLFVVGLDVGIVAREGWLGNSNVIDTAVVFAGRINPDLILYLFLPVLIFNAAYELDIHIFRKTLTNASLLSIPGVVVAMLLTASMMMLISLIFPTYADWNWTVALMFGALISATDPVAVVALLQELGTSKRFSTLIDAESLLNDGTGIVLFMVFFGTFSATQSLFPSPYIEFAVVVAGGALLGYLIARICLWFLTKVRGDALLQNSALILSAYLTFFVAETVGLSGVIALVAFGLTVAYLGSMKLKPSVNKFMKEFWELVAYIANTLIFILVGVIIALNVSFTWVDLGVLLAVYLGLNIIRTAVVFLLYPIMRVSGYGVSFSESRILIWGCLRGAVGLTLALLVSTTVAIPESIRHQVLFLTAGVVTLTLTLNATTIKKLLTRLGLTEVSSATRLVDSSVHLQLCEESEKYLENMRKREALTGTDWQMVERYLPSRQGDIQTEARSMDVRATLRLRALDKERSIYWSLYAEGIISSKSVRQLTASIDELYDKDGTIPLSARTDFFEFYRKYSTIRKLRRLPMIHDWVERHFQRKIIEGYDLARGHVIAQLSVIKLIEDLEHTSDLVTPQHIADLLAEVRNNVTTAEEYMSDMAREFPHSYQIALTQKSIRMLQAHERRLLSQFVKEGLMGEVTAQNMEQELARQHQAVEQKPRFWRRKKNSTKNS